MGSSSPSEIGRAAPFPLTPIEVATALVFGKDPHTAPNRVTPDLSMRQALEDRIREAFLRGPVFVSFSGGRDSSAILALATHVARKEGLDLPIPITLRIIGSESADETRWQELVLSHLELNTQECIRVTDQLDLVGPVASRVLRRHGLLWPPNAFMHDVILSRCSGGTLLTGAGGDELLGDSAEDRTYAVLGGRAIPRPRDVLRLGAATLAPRWYDRRRARFIPRMPWLSDRGQEKLARRFVADLGLPQRPWSESVHQLQASRSMAALGQCVDLLAQDHDASVCHPLLDTTFLMVAASSGGRSGLGGRESAMRRLVGDLLPDELIRRADKAALSDALWTPAALTFANEAASIEVIASDPQIGHLIDPVGLAHVWQRAPAPHMTTALLQAAYLARNPV